MNKRRVAGLAISFAWLWLVLAPFIANAQTINSLGAGRGSVIGADLFPSYQGANPAVRPSATQIAAYVYGLMSGDATANGTGTITFATVNGNVGSFGSTTQSPTITVNAKGLITAASAGTCAPAIGSVSGLGTGVATALGVNVGSAGGPVVLNGALGTPSSGTLTNATGLPIGGTTGWGTGVAAALANPINATNGFATYVLGSSSAFGLVKVDGTTITASAGVISAATLTVTTSTQTGSNYPIVTGDQAKVVYLNNASPQVPTIAQAGTTGFAAGWFVQACNIGAGTQTITPATSTIGGAATFVLPAASAARPACVAIISDGTNYLVYPDFPMDASMFSAGTLAVARGGTGITSFGTGVATALGNNVNTNGGPLTAATAAIAANAIVTGAGSGTPLTGTTPGTGVLTAIGVNLSAAGGLTTTVASGTSALGTSAISSAACASAVTTSATNTATTDVIQWGFNGDPTAVTGYVPLVAGMLTIIAYPSANNVNFKVCNNTSSSVTPGAITLNWRVAR